jgi:FkbM family methyltransferase
MQSPAIFGSETTLVSSHRQSGITKRCTRIIFDVGMNNGDDSAHYLSKGYQVVAIEANPILVECARARFQREIAAGQIVIECVGIVDQPGKIPFWINDERDVFSSFDRARASRNGMKCHPIEIECVTFDTVLKKYGVPYYLKLDAEGAEPYCLKRLQSLSLPEYVSVEAEELEYLLLLWQLGYRQFKIVDQMRHNSSFPEFTNDHIFSRAAGRACWYADRFKSRFSRAPFARGCSGPFGEETPSTWQTFDEVAYNWLHLHFGNYRRGSLNRFSWYDFHAKAGPNSTHTA